jgi:hypothetical protein
LVLLFSCPPSVPSTIQPALLPFNPHFLPSVAYYLANSHECAILPRVTQIPAPCLAVSAKSQCAHRLCVKFLPASRRPPCLAPPSLFSIFTFLFSVHSSNFRIPQPLCLPLLCDLCIPDGSPGPAQGPSPIPFSIFIFPFSACPISFVFKLFRTPLFCAKPHLFSFQKFLHSLEKAPGGGGTLPCLWRLRGGGQNR